MRYSILQYLFNFPLISPYIAYDFSWESPRIPLKILHCFISYESTKNPYKFCRESPGNPWRIHTEISPRFPRGFSFHLQPKFPRGFSSTKYPPSPGIPRRIRVIFPAGKGKYVWQKSLKWVAFPQTWVANLQIVWQWVNVLQTHLSGQKWVKIPKVCGSWHLCNSFFMVTMWNFWSRLLVMHHQYGEGNGVLCKPMTCTQHVSARCWILVRMPPPESNTGFCIVDLWSEVCSFLHTLYFLQRILFIWNHNAMFLHPYVSGLFLFLGYQGLGSAIWDSLLMSWTFISWCAWPCVFWFLCMITNCFDAIIAFMMDFVSYHPQRLSCVQV
mgnify:CR=1 FL=1